MKPHQDPPRWVCQTTPLVHVRTCFLVVREACTHSTPPYRQTNRLSDRLCHMPCMHMQFACAATALTTLVAGAVLDPANRQPKPQQPHPTPPNTAAGDSSASTSSSPSNSSGSWIITAAVGAAVVSAVVPGDALPAVSSLCLLAYVGIIVSRVSEWEDSIAVSWFH
jgi:hypothetical protein